MIKHELNKTFPKKYLGQNYLIDENISRNIVNSFEIKPDESVIEIGPGTGALTKYLIHKTKNLIAVELDKNNCKILKEKFPELNIINADILKINFPDIIQSTNPNSQSAIRLPAVRHGNPKLRVIGNIPYSISSPILFKLIDNRSMISDAQLMFQEEVAQRLTAKPNTKQYGILSVFIQVFSYTKLLFKVSKNCFYPRPKVDSRIVKFVFSNKLEEKIINIEHFRKIVRTAFGTRRKTLRNSLKPVMKDLDGVIESFDFSRRAENLSVEEFIELSNKLYSENWA